MKSHLTKLSREEERCNKIYDWILRKTTTKESKNIYFCNLKPYFNLHLDGVFYKVEILFAEDVLLQENFISCCEHVDDIEIWFNNLCNT